jgi:hypothetical protein
MRGETIAQRHPHRPEREQQEYDARLETELAVAIDTCFDYWLELSPDHAGSFSRNCGAHSKRNCSMRFAGSLTVKKPPRTATLVRAQVGLSVSVIVAADGCNPVGQQQ